MRPLAVLPLTCAPRASSPFFPSQSFVLHLATIDRVLMFHVPLWRPTDADCGVWNRHGPLYEGRGYSYTNLTPLDVTDRLLRELQPKFVFSGDAHEQCEFTHRRTGFPDATERTLNTFSWLQGNRIPSFGFAYDPSAVGLSRAADPILPRSN